MDIELLRTFLEVKNTRHFGKAAENLYLTQAAVSARIKQLENILGAPLFTRFRNNLQLTVTGERLVNHAETILIAWERARQDVALRKRQKQVLSLGGTSGLWDLILQDALHIIHRSLPSLALRAEAHSSETLIRNLMERTLDIALIYEPAKMSELESIPMPATTLVLVSNMPSQPVEMVQHQGYVAVDWGMAFQMNHAQHFPEASPPVLHTSLARIALDFILTHGGCAYLPTRMIADQLNKCLWPVEGAPVISRPIYACHHKENTHTEEITSILQIIRSLDVPFES